MNHTPAHPPTHLQTHLSVSGPASSPAHSRHSAATYLPTLDGWRSVAILLVLFAHACESLRDAMPFALPGDLAGFKHVGLMGVQLFFGLSGFLITSKLLEEEARHGRISLLAFYLRRSFRILPAALCFLGGVGLLSLVGVLDISLGRWVSTLLFAANYSTAEHSWFVGHFWSLAVEEHFYFLWPAAFLLLGLGQTHVGQRRVALVVFLALALALWRVLDFKFHITQTNAAQFWGRTDIQADGILWGVWLALLYANPVWQQRLRQLFQARAAWPVLCALLLVLEALSDGNWKLSFLLISVKAMLLPLLMLGTVLQPTRLAGRVLESAAFRWVGRLSYSLYLWQQLFLVWAEDRVPAMGLLQSFPLNLAAAFACAMLSLWLVETPLIALGHRLIQRLQRKQRIQSVRPPISHSHHSC